jgi:hypothetical protein
MSDVLARLSAMVGSSGGILADAAAAAPPSDDDASPHGALAAGGPRAAADPPRYELLVEAIREGYLLHYGRARVVHTDDPDLALLAGDRLYALGLAELAELGDLPAVAELADVISLAAAAHARADEPLADAVWDGGATAVGWGTSAAHEHAKSLARAGDEGAAGALRAAARQARESVAQGH